MKNSVGLVAFLVLAAAAPASAQSAAPSTERFVLTGVIVYSGEEGVAFLQEPSLTQNQVVPLRRGDRIGPWKLARLRDNGVELEGPSGTILVPLQGGSAGPGAVAGAPQVIPPASAAAPIYQIPGTSPTAAQSQPAAPSGAAAAPVRPPAAVGAAAAPAGTPTPGFVWDSDPRAQEALRAAGRAAPAVPSAGTTSASGAATPGAAAIPAGAATPGAAVTPGASLGASGPVAPNQSIRLPQQSFKELFGLK